MSAMGRLMMVEVVHLGQQDPPCPSRGRVRRPCLHSQRVGRMLNHIRTGRVQSGSNVAFLHTGDTGNLFEIPQVVGNVAESRMSQLSTVNN